MIIASENSPVALDMHSMNLIILSNFRNVIISVFICLLFVHLCPSNSTLLVSILWLSYCPRGISLAFKVIHSNDSICVRLLAN